MPAEPRQAVFYAHSINLSFIKLALKRTFTETGLLSKEKERKKKRLSSRHGSGHLKPSLCDHPWDELLSEGTYRKVASSNTSCLETHAGFFRLKQ